MFRMILAPVDGSPCGEAAALALSLAGVGGGRVTFLHVTPVSGESRKVAATLGDALLEQWTRRAVEHGVMADRLLRSADDVGTCIVDVARLIRCDAIVMGTHARNGLAHLRLGSVAERVAQLSDVPVLLVHGEPPHGARELRRVLVAVDGAETSQETLRVAAEFAKSLGAELELLTVRPNVLLWLAQAGVAGDYERLERDLEKGAASVLERAMSWAQRAGVEPRWAGSEPLQGSAERVGEVIVRIAQERGADLVVVGAHRRSPLDRWLLGSTAQRVLHGSPVPVLLVRLDRVAAQTAPSDGNPVTTTSGTDVPSDSLQTPSP